MRCSLKIIQDITKQQVTNLSLPGDTERITQPTSAELCPNSEGAEEGKTASLSLSRPSPFYFLSLLHGELKTCKSRLQAIYSQGTNLHRQPLSESLYQLGATVFIITCIIVEAGQTIVLRCASQEGERDEINASGVKPQLDSLLD